jgi:hypothetical protein
MFNEAYQQHVSHGLASEARSYKTFNSSLLVVIAMRCRVRGTEPAPWFVDIIGREPSRPRTNENGSNGQLFLTTLKSKYAEVLDILILIRMDP